MNKKLIFRVSAKGDFYCVYQQFNEKKQMFLFRVESNRRLISPSSVFEKPSEAILLACRLAIREVNLNLKEGTK